MFKKRAIASLILLVCAAIVYLFIGSPLFVLEKIEISNSNLFASTPTLRQGRPAGLIDEESLSCWKGKNIFLIPLDALKEGIEEIPEVKYVVIKKELPHKLTIAIHEYKPCAFLRRNRELAVSKEGVVFPFKRATEVSFPSTTFEGGWAGYPLVIYEKENSDVGKAWPGLKEAMETYLAVKDIVPIEFIKVKMNDEIFFYTKNTNTEIRMGSGEYKKKAEHLKILMEELPSKSVEYIDLRFGKDVIVKP